MRKEATRALRTKLHASCFGMPELGPVGILAVHAAHSSHRWCEQWQLKITYWYGKSSSIPMGQQGDAGISRAHSAAHAEASSSGKALDVQRRLR